MIVEDEGDGVAQTNDFEAPGEQIEMSNDEDAPQLMNRCIKIFEIIRCTRIQLIILWSTCGPIMETKELMFKLCTSNKFYVNIIYARYQHLLFTCDIAFYDQRVWICMDSRVRI